MISVNIIEDSINPDGKRITTAIWIYPRFILSEINTHRVLSKNSASSRAISINKMIEAVETKTAYPEYWGTTKPGMQSGEELLQADQEKAKAIWLQAMQDAVRHVKELSALNVHKSITNRIIEPFMHMCTLVTGTEWENFFALRAHKDAQPEFQVLAYMMLDRYLTHKPHQKAYSEWHIPFGDFMPPEADIATKLKIATARAARTSYTTMDSAPSFEKDIALHDRLFVDGHFSPSEHAAIAVEPNEHNTGNFVGWKPYRKTLKGETRTADLQQLWNNRSDWIKSKVF